MHWLKQKNARAWSRAQSWIANGERGLNGAVAARHVVMASNPDPENWHMQRREKVPSLAMPAFLRRCVVAPTSLVPIWHAKMLNGTSGNLGRLVLPLVDTVSHGGVEWSNERRIGVVNLLLAIPSKLLCTSDKECPKAVDCEMGDWEDWGGCSSSCDGTKRRIRSIKTHARGKGSACKDETVQIAPCNPSKDATGCPILGMAIDCLLTDWSDWSPCAVTCGAAQIMRSRSVKIEPMNDGKACDSVLNQTENCHGLPKCEKAGTERDCKWSQWSQWSECTKCGGEMYRVRQVEDHAE